MSITNQEDGNKILFPFVILLQIQDIKIQSISVLIGNCFLITIRKICRNPLRIKGNSLFISLLERSRRALSDCAFRGVPVLEDAWLLGVPGLRPASVLKESRRSGCTTGLSLPPSRRKALAVFLMTSWSSEPSSEEGTGSARVLCLTEFRLCARTRDQLVERKLSASNQNRARWSTPRSSVKCI